jgi:hypothetical protein
MAMGLQIALPAAPTFFSYTVFQRHRRIRSEIIQNEYRAQTPSLLGKNKIKFIIMWCDVRG